jgi:phosphoglycerate dehydrogenase-like enzyme
MRPGTRPTGPADRRGDGRGWWWARSRAGQAAGTGRPGGGSAARPSAARSRRTAWGSVTAPRIRRGPPQLHARQLRGKLVGLVGLGAIGRQVAKRLQAFDTEVRYFDIRRPMSAEEQALGVRFQELDSLHPEVDIVSLHVPYTQATRRMLSRERIGRLRPGAIVINTARGEVVDEVALAEALLSGRLGGAGLDVFGGEPPAADHPLLGVRVPGLVLAPHVAGSVFDNVGNVARHVFRNIQRVLDGQPLPPADLVALDAGD